MSLPYPKAGPARDRRGEEVAIYHQSHQAMLPGHPFDIPILEKEDTRWADPVHILRRKEIIGCTQDWKAWQAPQFLRLGYLGKTAQTSDTPFPRP